MKTDKQKANEWWDSLSINQMKALNDKHGPKWEWYKKQYNLYQLGELSLYGYVEKFWVAEGKPEKQKTIPVRRKINQI